MSIVRRTGLVEPGTALLLADSSLYAPKRLHEFAAYTGISPRNLLTSPLCSVPLPLYNWRATTPGARRWTGTRPEAMWHPLMWLPNRLAGRYTYRDPETGAQVRESDEVWTIRACLELTASGLYDVETGTWADILSSVDIDTTDELDAARVEEWLDGSPDEVLDSIDLTDYLTIEPHDWALADALTLLRPVTEASWALTADEIYGEVMRVTNPESGVNETELLQIAAALCATGMALLHAVPLTTTDGVPTSTTVEPHGDFFYRAYRAVDGANADARLLSVVLDAVSERCLTLREAFWSSLEELHAPPQEVGA